MSSRERRRNQDYKFRYCTVRGFRRPHREDLIKEPGIDEPFQKEPHVPNLRVFDSKGFQHAQHRRSQRQQIRIVDVPGRFVEDGSAAPQVSIVLILWTQHTKKTHQAIDQQEAVYLFTAPQVSVSPVANYPSSITLSNFFLCIRTLAICIFTSSWYGSHKKILHSNLSREAFV